MIKLEEQNYRASRSLANQIVALEPIDALHCKLWFRDLDLGVLEVVPPKQWLDQIAQRPLRAHKEPANRGKKKSRRASPPAATPSRNLSAVAA